MVNLQKNNRLNKKNCLIWIKKVIYKGYIICFYKTYTNFKKIYNQFFLIS